MLQHRRDLVGVQEVRLMRRPELLTLRAENLRSYLDPDAFDHVFKECDALWQHSGNPKAPHAELTSGKHSDGFVNVLAVLKYSTLCEIMAAQIADRVIDYFTGTRLPDWVIGSDHAGAVLAFEVARQLGVKSDFTEKGEGKSQNWKRFEILPGETVLQVEELVTTSLTLSEVRKGILKGNPSPVEFFPFVITLVNRSPMNEFDGVPLLSVRDYSINTWEPADCPLCQLGSKAIKPKANWAELTASYD